MSKIIIGTAAGKNVGFDIAELLVTRLLVQANSGGGKSFLLRRILEQAFGKVQAIVIDPAGEFATLREKFGYVLVGEHGETPADIRSAGLVAEKLLELRASAVCDLYALKPGERHLWLQKFLTAVMNAPKRLWHPVLFVVDEAHKFMPEKGEGESEAKEMMLSLASDGRKYGFCAIFATQRLAKLDKSGASELLNVLVGPTFMDIDLERAHKALGITNADKRDFNEQMRTIAPGHFWALGRAISKTRLLVKIGAIETTHPTAGSGKYSAEPPPAPEQVKLLLPKLSDLPKEAEEKARTEAEFRREIRELKIQLRTAERVAKVEDSKPGAPRSPEQHRTIRQLESNVKALAKIARRLKEHGDGVPISLNQEALRQVLAEAEQKISRLVATEGMRARKAYEQLMRDAEQVLARLGIEESPEMREESRPAAARELRPALAPAGPSAIATVDGITPAQMRILRALAEFHAIGVQEVSKKWLAARAGASHKSSAYSNNLGALRSRGLIDYRSGAVLLAEAGLEAAGPHAEPLTPEEMKQSCRALLTPAQQRIFDALYQVFPSSLSKEGLAEGAGASPTSSAFSNNLGALRSAGMIDYLPDRSVVMQKWIFLEAA